jgi:hypothetical protein
MKRIDWVRIVLDGDDCRAEVHGVGHRVPRTVRVAMATASTLAAEGVPLLVRRTDDRSASAAASASASAAEVR